MKVKVVTSILDKQKRRNCVETLYKSFSLGALTTDEFYSNVKLDVGTEIRNSALDWVYDFSSKRRQYSSVMVDRIFAIQRYTKNNEDVLIFNIDDDYSVNTQVFSFARKLFENYSEIWMASMLKHPGSSSSPRFKMLGHEFCQRASCMGGSLIFRWSKFIPLFNEFVETHHVTSETSGEGGMFDTEFFHFLQTKGIKEPVTMIQDYSLVQHCNLGSHYIEQKGDLGIRAHMYGEDFDPYVSPWNRVELDK
jgi:hypothetical protein